MTGRTLRLAHRGDWRAAPENTVAAMRAALAIAACDGLEFDVRTSSDGVPVVIHDATLERVQGRPEAVDTMTAEALAALDVPTLADVLEAAGRRSFLDVELKSVPGPAIVEVLAAGRGPQLIGAVISSFEEAALARMQRLAPSWPRWLGAYSLEPAVLDRATELGCVGISVAWETVDEDAMARARAVGLQIAAWTVRDRATFDHLANLGLAAVCVEAAALDG
jgi:Glycerophosphoryl diester phosphodiesterase